MTLQDLGNLGEFVAAVAVVISLIYLSIQVAASRSEFMASQEREKLTLEFTANEFFNELRMLVAGDESLADISIRGCQNLEDLNPKERLRFNELTRSWMWAFHKFYLQQKVVSLSVNFANTGLPLFSDRFAGDGFANWWREHRNEFGDEDFISAMDELVLKIGST